MSKKILSFSFVVLFLSALTFAATSDELQRKIMDETHIQGLQVNEENGAVVLRGEAELLKDKVKAEKIAKEKTKDNVINQISVRPVQRKDEDMTLDIYRKFRSRASRNYEFNTISAKTLDGNVILMGKVRDAQFSRIAEESAMEIPGVRSVDNRIEILPVSEGDERIRTAILNLMKRDDHLYTYFFSNKPSINIIVERGRVTLVGAVDTEGDRARAAIRARQVLGVLSVDNQLRVE